MTNYYVYILYSSVADKYYVGSTANLQKRIWRHNNTSFNTFSSKFRPWKLVAAFEAGKSRGEAEKMERFIKRQKSRGLIEKLVNPDFVPKDKLAQLVRVPQLRD